MKGRRKEQMGKIGKKIYSTLNPGYSPQGHTESDTTEETQAGRQT